MCPFQRVSQHRSHGNYLRLSSFVQMDCPVNVDSFETLLIDHPNQVFVKSVCRSLCEGFWPFADTKLGDYPITWDFSDWNPKSLEHTEFIAKQIVTEVEKG